MSKSGAMKPLYHQLLTPAYGTIRKTAQQALADPAIIEQLVYLVIHEQPLPAGRASWALSIAVEKEPTIIRPYLKQIIALLHHDRLPVPVRRNVLRILQFITIPGRFHAQLIEKCFDILNDNKQAIAVQVFAMTVLANMADTMPEIARELCLHLEERMPFKSAGYRSRAARILKRFRHNAAVRR